MKEISLMVFKKSGFGFCGKMFSFALSHSQSTDKPMQVSMMFCEILFYKKETIDQEFNGKNPGKGFA